jgi:hypothetical protein
MSGFILFMMFFVSPPAAPGKQVWSLHNTEHLEFASMDACKKYGLLMQARFQKVATVKIRGWCVNQKDGTSTYDVKNPHLPLTSGDIYEIPTDVNIDDPKEGY